MAGPDAKERGKERADQHRQLICPIISLTRGYVGEERFLTSGTFERLEGGCRARSRRAMLQGTVRGDLGMVDGRERFILQLENAAKRTSVMAPDEVNAPYSDAQRFGSGISRASGLKLTSTMRWETSPRQSRLPSPI